MTADEARAKVRARWPDASSELIPGGPRFAGNPPDHWYVDDRPTADPFRVPLGSGADESAAWLEAARRMENDGGPTT